MGQSNHKPAYILSAIIAILAAAASAGGLLIEGVYRDNVLITSAFRGNDLVTLVLVVPLMIASMIASLRGSLRAQLIWPGTLGYMLYNYAFYLFGAAFNVFFWVYVALFSLSVFALIFSLSGIDAGGISRTFSARTPVKWIGGYILLFSLLIGAMWIARSLTFFTTGQVPQDVLQTGHPTAVVYALDVSLLVPCFVLSAVWLWRRQPWGYVLATIMMVKGVTYPAALIAMSLFADWAGVPNAWSLAPLWALLGAGCLLALGFLLGSIRPASAQIVGVPAPGGTRVNSSGRSLNSQT